MPKREWFYRLSIAAKAEILATILHELECPLHKIFVKLPRKTQKLINAGLHDCGVWSHELTKKDIKHIQEWMNKWQVGRLIADDSIPRGTSVRKKATTSSGRHKTRSGR